MHRGGLKSEFSAILASPVYLVAHSTGGAPGFQALVTPPPCRRRTLE
jgi:hypothetical protein